MKATGLQSIKPIKTSVDAADVPDYADIVRPTEDGGFICRIRELPRWMLPSLPDEYVTEEKTGERESPTGHYTYPVLRKDWDVPELMWKLEPRPNGSAKWNRNWQPTEEELERQERRQRRDQILDLLADRLEGYDDAEAVVARILGEEELEPTPVATDEGPTREPPTVVVEGFEARMESPGRWTMPDGTTVEGSKEDARERLAEMVAELSGES